MTPRALQYGLRSLLVVVTIIAVAFGLSPWLDPLATLVTLLLLGGAAYLVHFCVHDVFGKRIVLPRGWRERHPWAGDEATADQAEQEARAAARNKLKRKWWRRRWPNRYKSYQPGQNYTFPGRREQQGDQ